MGTLSKLNAALKRLSREAAEQKEPPLEQLDCWDNGYAQALADVREAMWPVKVKAVVKAKQDGNRSPIEPIFDEASEGGTIPNLQVALPREITT